MFLMEAFQRPLACSYETLTEAQVGYRRGANKSRVIHGPDFPINYQNLTPSGKSLQ